MSRFLSDNYSKLVPYTPGEQVNVKVIKLNTNESPFPPSPKVKEVLNEEVIVSRHQNICPMSQELDELISEQYPFDPVANNLPHPYKSLQR